MTHRIIGYVLIYLSAVGYCFLDPMKFLPVALLGWAIGFALIIEGAMRQIINAVGDKK